MSDNRIHKINERIYYAVHLKLLSPLSISSGVSDITDSDVLLDGEGYPFVPGTSLAGAFRNNLDKNKDKECVMGYSKGEQGRMSQLFIQDVYLEDSKKSIRDGVRLNEEKTIEPAGKFDMEIVETGATGWLFMELNVRDGLEDAEHFSEHVNTVLCNLQSGEIRIGANKNRGFGRVEITEVYEKHFNRDNMEEWLDFLEDTHCIGKYQKENQTVSFKEWKAGKTRIENSRYLKITVPLELDGGISIRKYSAQPGKADYEHITCNGEPVIPGTSWNGAIRGRLLSLLKDLNVETASDYVDEWFGYVDNTKPKSDNENKENVRDKAKQSSVVIGESIIKGAKKLPMTRTKINRFDASALNGSLYQELSYFGGKTSLEIMVDSRVGDREAFLALLDFVIKDIQKGYLAIGGQTAVGRGLFKKSGDIVYSEEVNMEKCKKALFELVKG